MATKGKRAGHPGVVIYRRKDRPERYWCAEWVDPDLGKRIRRSLHGEGVSNRVQAVAWARDKSQELAGQRRQMRVSGRRTQVQTGWVGIFAAYLDAFESERGEAARRRTDRDWLKLWRQFLATHAIRTGGDLTTLHLNQYRAWLSRTGGALSPATKNRHLTAAKALLTWSRRQGYTRLTSDDIADSLFPFREEVRQPRVLSESQLRRLVAAVHKHDAARYFASREDKSAYFTGKPEQPGTSRFAPLAPFVTLALLTGARPGEVLALKWEDVDLERQEVRIWGSKTGRQRAITLEDCPLLREFLAALKLRSKGQSHVCGDTESGGPRVIRRTSWQRLARMAQLAGLPRKALRSTCVSYLANRSPYSEAALSLRFGHGADVSKRHYRAAVAGYRSEAVTIEAWLGVENILRQCLERLEYLHSESDSNAAEAA